MIHRPYILRQDTGATLVICPQCVEQGRNSATKFRTVASAELARDYHASEGGG